MKNRTVRGITALTLGAALLLSACGSSNDDAESSPSASASESTSAAEPTAADIAALEGVTLVGDPGTEPTLEFTAPFSTSAPVARIVTPGTGDELAAGDLIGLHTVVYDGATGELGNSSWAGEPEELTLGDTSLISVLNDTLVGQQVGTRFILSNPSTDSTYLMAVEVVSSRTIPSRAEGEAVTPADGLPTVTLDENGAPSVAIPEGYEAPAELVAQTLIKGAGDVVTEDQTVTVHYTGMLLDGTVFDSSWEGGAAPLTISLQSVIDGWTQGLAGQTVGSQVLLVIPSDLGYGSTGSGSIPADSPLIFVVDILDAK